MLIAFSGEPPVPEEGMERNRQHARSLGLKVIRGSGRRLAVVGGGPSVAGHLDALRAWDGEVWAINGACAWLRGHGIASTLISADPDPIVARWAQGASSAILCTRTDPAVFEVLKGADVRLYDVKQDSPDGITAGSSTAGCALHLGIAMGFRRITLFGCESSYEGGSHAYQHEDACDVDWMTVECEGRHYHTRPDFYVQAVELGHVLREYPHVFSEQSGGLLRALIQNPIHDIPEVSPSLLAKLKPIEASQPERKAA